MKHYAGPDGLRSLELSSVCVADAQGRKIVKEAKVASEPEALVSFFETLGFAVKLKRRAISNQKILPNSRANLKMVRKTAENLG